MVQTHPKKKIEIVIDAAAVDDVVGIAQRCGAKGYTILPHGTGRGPRGVRGAHDIFEEGQNKMVVVVADEPVVLRILDQVMSLLETHAGVAWVSDVQVARADHF